MVEGEAGTKKGWRGGGRGSEEAKRQIEGGWKGGSERWSKREKETGGRELEVEKARGRENEGDGKRGERKKCGGGGDFPVGIQSKLRARFFFNMRGSIFPSLLSELIRAEWRKGLCVCVCLCV